MFTFAPVNKTNVMGIDNAVLNRTRLLLGDETMERIGRARVIIFGVGGVGSWCAESLVRSGVRHMTIVDSDRVCITNINRQLMATTETIGRVKVEALKEHLLTVNPAAEIDARQEIFTAETASGFGLDGYDYIIDAIDSLADKALLIELACRTRARFFSSMGAALKLDPTRVRVAEFWRVEGCPLARALRQRFKRLKCRPARKFLCVYSDELLGNKGTAGPCGAEECVCAKAASVISPLAADGHTRKAQTNGSLMHITAIFGLTIAGLVIKDLSAEAR